MKIILILLILVGCSSKNRVPIGHNKVKSYGCSQIECSCSCDDPFDPRLKIKSGEWEGSCLPNCQWRSFSLLKTHEVSRYFLQATKNDLSNLVVGKVHYLKNVRGERFFGLLKLQLSDIEEAYLSFEKGTKYFAPSVIFKLSSNAELIKQSYKSKMSESVRWLKLSLKTIAPWPNRMEKYHLDGGGVPIADLFASTSAPILEGDYYKISSFDHFKDLIDRVLKVIEGLEPDSHALCAQNQFYNAIYMLTGERVSILDQEKLSMFSMMNLDWWMLTLPNIASLQNLIDKESFSASLKDDAVQVGFVKRILQAIWKDDFLKLQELSSKHQVDYTVKDLQGRSYLMLAAYLGKVKSLIYLLNQVHPNEAVLLDKNQKTALVWAKLGSLSHRVFGDKMGLAQNVAIVSILKERIAKDN